MQHQLPSSASTQNENPSAGNGAPFILGAAQSGRQKGLAVGKVLLMEKPRLEGDPVSPGHGSETG